MTVQNRDIKGIKYFFSRKMGLIRYKYIINKLKDNIFLLFQVWKIHFPFLFIKKKKIYIYIIWNEM